jgi:eukaryotic-like serine/threonine-protein kinase
MLASSTSTRIGKRYELQDRIGAGGMGTVYRALDRLTGQRVALKQVRSPEDGDGSSSRTESIDRGLALVHEFQTLASLRHPHIISVLDYGFEEVTPVPGAEPERLPYFTMDLLESAPSIIDAAATLDVQARLRLIVQVLQALAYLHRRGVLHRDLKPANVLVTKDDTGRPHIKLLDFGLALLTLTGSDAIGASSSSAAAGTFAYMAPEVLGGDTATEVSDLYSVGVIAYEMLAGKHPFSAGNIAQTISNVLNVVPETTVLGVSDEVQVVLHRLLAKQPDARYQTAGEAITALHTAAKLGELAETPAIRESFLQAAQFVGREKEMELLGRALIDAIEGHGSGWLIGGESGVGKSRLLNELRTRALVRGALVLRGQASRESTGPYALWIDALRWQTLAAPPDLREASVLKIAIPDISDLIGREVPDAPDIDPQAAQARLLAVVGSMFRRVGTPIVLLFEDLQWAGRDSLALLAHLHSFADDLPLLFLGSYRDDEAPDLPVSLPGMKVVRLPRLDAPGIAALSESMLGPVGKRQEVIDLLGRETEGNAFFVVEVVRALAEEAGDLDDIGKKPLPQQVATGGVEELIHRRLERVPEGSRPLLEAAAVIGRFLDLDLIDRVMLGAAPDAASEARLTRQLVGAADAAVFEVQNGRWCFAHDKLREHVLATLPTGRGLELHRKVAEAIEALRPDADKEAALLAHHWRAAGNDVKEAYYAAIAGTRLCDTSAYQDALIYLERALTLIRKEGAVKIESQIKQSLIRHQIARAYLALGELDKAQQQQEENLAITTQLGDSRGMTLARRGLGDVYDARGDYASAREQYESSLFLCQRHGYKDGIARAAHALGRIAEKTGDYPLAMIYQQESITISHAIDDRRGEGDALRALGSISSMQGRYDEAEKYYLQSLDIARELGNRRGMAGALNNLGVNSESQGKYVEAARFYDESLKIKQEIGDRRGAAITMTNIGTAAYTNKDFPTARKMLGDAMTSFEQIGDRQGVADVLNNIALVDYDERNYEVARKKWQDSLTICEEIKDRWGVALAHLNIAKAWREEGDFLRAKNRFLDALQVASEISKDPTTLEILQEYAVMLSYQGRNAEAAMTNAHIIANTRTPGLVRKRAEAQMHILEVKLGAEGIAAAKAQGEAKPLADVVAGVLTG